MSKAVRYSRNPSVTKSGAQSGAAICATWWTTRWAIASADMDQAGAVGVENHYRFVLTRNNTNSATNSGAERALELVDNDGVNDANAKPVSTTLHFTGLTHANGVDGTGTHTFYFLGRKVQAADATAAVLDASLSLLCVDTSILIPVE